ncbi:MULTISPECIES: HTR-like protein [Haloferax]|uniref:HTR-like protein n=1 Tax=Haloferax marinum TaxID=2666143 RepID=A0A6A8GAM6_9EURY|nr:MULTISPECIES: HTR-like protein [Haloferax]KAB1198660.1 HTR-like protein [Haloferax sp. CBA1150]MRW97775.1 HTR-like protein [Haloferax marinum]
MRSIPFGIPRLDSIIGGGAPPGNVVLLAGESGAGAREFLYTSVTMNALSQADEDLFDLHYGTLDENASPPPEIHYVSFTSGEDHLRQEMLYTMDDEMVDAAIDNIEFHDLSPEYFQLSPIPREWYLGEPTQLEDLGHRQNRESVLASFGSTLSEHAPENLVVIDSLTDLVAGRSDDMKWADITMVMKGLEKASHQWGGLILVLVSTEAVSDRELGILKGATDGTLQFSWETGGSKRARTMVVQEFRGVLSQLESENIVQFETEINESGLDVSDVRKIR